jgi:hypothetical protein
VLCLQILREAFADFILAVVYEYEAGLLLKAGQPVCQAVFVRVAALTGQRRDLAFTATFSPNRVTLLAPS